MTNHPDQEGMKIRRFSRGRIVEHALAIVVVGILVMTGLSQKFYTIDFSQWLILKLGGIDNVRWLHRCAGMVFLMLIVVHIFVAMVGIVARRWQPSMMINKNDFTNAIHNLKYYVGLEKAPAQFDRYDFKQKFEYWGILVGAFLMIFSGLILWFPIQATRFLPGEFVPAAKVLHTHQATLIFILIAIWHIYSAIFSPDVFPLDTSIFTGMIPRRRMELEHPLEFARMHEGGARADVSRSP
ncbi:MAG: cytochrome C [Nitrospirae bacterium CG_4_9_14_3_um_filter_53_35]|nr:MAG: hypothetical protein AUK29_09915 [Nitrospirae bacterium CG2_30_53_67]PIS37108.1 MAG: cytochrome C [Nitrospirae bacterium CG08_land_8_20_14_0_20_52_24]PIV82797.1 MAG: cytochrome C [Nitrospirae bacterium CG17_big_fil_post_rev_8_21_14_2_50_50_9]PIW84968.1 MAG: cytochrome C [Nitrospirae bacterium CG_4_8_14_3_um_filter_50_41]PIX85484.1 MAG: cytochrome C [Nitrospirae bacterium CG_4_10_14_3_um_filter_53_41]PJA75111.1 MAG: cytochrome C [Nitrospirae bacterium CG_4_9_14_3_um_filter_53_35]